MDDVEKTFDAWAKSGRSETAQKEHQKNVLKLLDSIKFNTAFTFLDVGCGNGWVVRKIAQHKNCKKAIGVDKSQNMINLAKKSIKSDNEEFIKTEIETLQHTKKFDYIFSMEAIYYSKDTSVALKKIYSLLKQGGMFICGTDYYAENKVTARWEKMMKLKMHWYSKKEWSDLFKSAGFDTRTRQIKDIDSSKAWKREFGTLFIIGVK